MTRLLVSVRNVEEAEQALLGGCDILDVKEPSRGALGRADAAEWARLAALVQHRGGAVPLSVACGEAADILHPLDPVPNDLWNALTYCKLGTARLGDRPAWEATWTEACHRCHVERSCDEPTAHQGVRSRWIPVAYADWQHCAGPSISRVVDWLVRSPCAGLLIDTYHKAQGRLFDHCQPVELAECCQHLHGHGRWLALAGSLRLEEIGRLQSISPDIVGIRGAACIGGHREARISADHVREFRTHLCPPRISSPLR